MIEERVKGVCTLFWAEGGGRLKTYVVNHVTFIAWLRNKGGLE